MMHPPSQRGFTLVETLIAITVLVIAIVGPLWAVHQSVTAAYTARDSLIATSLAQEGMEYVRNIRDTNYLSGADSSNWLSGLDNCLGTNGCTVDPNTLSIQTCAAKPSGAPTGCLPLHTDANYRYVQGASGTLTRFTREVKITTVTPGQEVQVTVTVYWSSFKIPYSVSVTEHLYNWQQ